MNTPRRQSPRGFTLIEVLVAMLVAALGIGALLTTVSSSADTVSRLRDKSLAQWIALNQIAELRLSGNQPSVGVTRGTVDYAGGTWKWEAEVTDQGVGGILRVEVRVAPQAQTMGRDSRQDGTTSSDQSVDKPMAAVGTAFGFLGSAVQRPSGLTPDWSFASAAPRGGGGPGGAPGGAPPPASQP